MIAILDIGIGNINSVAKALTYIAADFKVVKTEKELLACTKIIFPGVGSFSNAAKKLESTGLKSVIQDQVLVNKVPFFGICLGMQLIANTSVEGGFSSGLSLINAEIKKIPEDKKIKIPHMGWNNVKHNESGLFKNIKNQVDFYFVHSYRMILHDKKARCFYTEYGGKVIAYVEKDNIYGAQFHPEKSQGNGIAMLKNFSELC